MVSHLDHLLKKGDLKVGAWCLTEYKRKSSASFHISKMSVMSINASYLFNNYYKSDLYRVGRYALKTENPNYFFDICHPNEKLPDKLPFKCCGTKTKACKNATTANVKITSRKNHEIRQNPFFKGKEEFTLSLREFLKAVDNGITFSLETSSLFSTI